MTNDLAKDLRESAAQTFYDPLKSEFNKAADHIEKLEAALREIAAPSKVVARGEDMILALKVLLSSHRETARAALGEKKDD
jgi:hypothetical protein